MCAGLCTQSPAVQGASQGRISVISLQLSSCMLQESFNHVPVLPACILTSLHVQDPATRGCYLEHAGSYWKPRAALSFRAWVWCWLPC